VLTNPLGSLQTNCTTTLTQGITSDITELNIVGNTCSSAVGGSRNILTNLISFVPTSPLVLTNVIRGFSRITNNFGGQIVFNPNSIEYIKCVYTNRFVLGYNGASGWAYYCDGEVQIGSQLYINNSGTSLANDNGDYVIDLSSYPTSLTSNYNLTPPGSKFIIQLTNGVVVNIINFNDIGNCPSPCTSCPP
jgi:hypothetical protein